MEKLKSAFLLAWLLVGELADSFVRELLLDSS
jgi:hypothetical protein